MDQGNEKGDARRTSRSNKRYKYMAPDTEMGSKALGGAVIVFSAIGITYLIFNDATGVGCADDVAIVPVLELFRRGLSMW